MNSKLPEWLLLWLLFLKSSTLKNGLDLPTVRFQFFRTLIEQLTNHLGYHEVWKFIGMYNTLQKKEVYAWWNDLAKCFKSAIFLEYENPCIFFRFSFWLYFFPGKNEILGSSKWNKKKLHWFLYFKYMVNFVAFLWISSFFKTRLFLKSEYNTFVWQKKNFPKI